MNSPNLFNRRLGKFSLNSKLISEDTGKCFAILNTVIPVRAEYEYVSGYIEYTALSHSFDILKEGEEPPRYKVIVEGQFIRWEKQD